MSERLKIGKQLEKSMNPWSVLITLDNNEGAYLPPGDNGQILTLSNGLINWADPALEINGTPGYLAKFDGLGTNIEDSPVFDASDTYTDIRFFGTENSYISFITSESVAYIEFMRNSASGVTGYDTNGIRYQYDLVGSELRNYGQLGGIYSFNDLSNYPFLLIASTTNKGVSVPSVPDTYTSARFKNTSNCAGLDANILSDKWVNNYVARSIGLFSVFGDIQISNHTIPDYEDVEGSNFLRFSSFATDFVNSTTIPFTFVVGGSYKIINHVIGDDFTNIADVQVGTINTDNCIFIATGTTPTTWTNGSEIGDIAEIDNNQCIINNTGTDFTFDTVDYANPILSYDFKFDGTTEFQIFKGEGITTVSGNKWDLKSGNNGGGTLGSEDSIITVVIDGTTYGINALKI